MDKHYQPLDTSDALLELLERSRRTESRLVQLGDYVGANVRVKQQITVLGMGRTDIHVEVDSLNVSLARILAELKRENDEGGHGCIGTHWVKVYQVLPGGSMRIFAQVPWTVDD